MIDDEPQLGELLSSVLKDEGFEVDVAANTTLGGLKLLALKPELLLLDLRMPGVDGFTFLEYVNAVVASPPPVVILSGAHSLESVLRGVKLGAFAFLPKPIHFGKLVDTCRAALARAKPGSLGGSHHERRIETRKPVLVGVRIAPEPDASVLERLVEGTTGGHGAVGEMIDMSVGGARIISMAEIPVGARIQMAPDPVVVGSSAILTGEVRWREVVDAGIMYGLQFVELDPEVEQLLRCHLGDG